MGERWPGPVGSRGVVGRISILLLVYPRQWGSYRATTMSPVMSTVRHCPLLPGESIFVGSRAESGNYATAILRGQVLDSATVLFLSSNPRIAFLPDFQRLDIVKSNPLLQFIIQTC